MSSDLLDTVAAHYGRNSDLLETIRAGLIATGADPDAPTLEDLAPVDEFHTAGRATTLRALSLMPIAAGMHVLDAGSGIGGTARCLARDYDCRVTGLDLTPDYVSVAKTLTDLTGLADNCAFEQGSVTAMPFDDGSFDGAVTFHVAMNVADRAAFYGEVARVLRPGAPFCLFDVMKGATPGMRYPVPWAETEATSFLKTPPETVELLQAAGFAIVDSRSQRDFAREFFRERVPQSPAERQAPPPLGLHLLLGDNAREKFTNYIAALEDHQVDPVVMVARNGG